MINWQIFVRGLICSVAFVIELLFLWRAKIHARRPNPSEVKVVLTWIVFTDNLSGVNGFGEKFFFFFLQNRVNPRFS